MNILKLSYQIRIRDNFRIQVSSSGHHLDNVELFCGENPPGREVLKSDDVAGLGHDDDRAVARRNVANLLVGQRSHEFRRRNSFVVDSEMSDLK